MSAEREPRVSMKAKVRVVALAWLALLVWGMITTGASAAEFLLLVVWFGLCYVDHLTGQRAELQQRNAELERERTP